MQRENVITYISFCISEGQFQVQHNIFAMIDKEFDNKISNNVAFLNSPPAVGRGHKWLFLATSYKDHFGA